MFNGLAGLDYSQVTHVRVKRRRDEVDLLDQGRLDTDGVRALVVVLGDGLLPVPGQVQFFVSPLRVQAGGPSPV